MLQHTIGYIIETNNERTRLEYRPFGYTPSASDVWVDGVNSFSDISEADPDNYDSPLIIRVMTGTEAEYYRKTLMIDEGLNSFTVSVMIDGVEGSTSFVVEEYCMFLTHKVVGSKVYVSISPNRLQFEREGTITFIHRANDNIKTTLYIEQEKCNIAILLGNCLINNGVDSEYQVHVNDTSFEYTFDTLTDETDVDKQSLVFDVLLEGPHKKYFVKTVKQYVKIGNLDNTYTLIDGEYYRRKKKYVNGRYVYYYGKVVVDGDGVVYDLQTYDGGLKLDLLRDTFSISNYGRTFMKDKSFYIVTLCNYDDVNRTCTITLKYDDNPTTH